VSPSPDRIPAFCKHFGTCGGCKWQDLSYPKQLEYKQQQVIDNLERIGGLELPEVTPIMASSELHALPEQIGVLVLQQRGGSRKMK
jgi:23S rRNA (uracil1939-C5)-methyltransferase